MSKKVQGKVKTTKEMIKDLETKMVGMKKGKEKNALLKQIEALNLKEKQEKEKKQNIQKDKVIAPVKQIIPVGIDPKTIQCINYLNKVCKEGANCKFSHESVKKSDKEKSNDDNGKPRVLCQFLIDAINNNEYSSNWACPIPKCRNIHKLMEIKDNEEVQLTLEEYIELSRQSLPDNLTPLNEERFNEWKLKKAKEQEAHAKKIVALASGISGADLFKTREDLFKDDEEAADVDYKERCYSDSESEEEEPSDKS